MSVCRTSKINAHTWVIARASFGVLKAWTAFNRTHAPYYCPATNNCKLYLLFTRDCIEKSRKRPRESDSAGNKRARLDRRNRNDRDRRRNETEEEKNLRLAKRRERDRARRAASSEKKKKKAAELETQENRVARLDQMKT